MKIKVSTHPVSQAGKPLPSLVALQRSKKKLDMASKENTPLLHLTLVQSC